MNEKLKFSWGHIIAFLALIFIAYVVFMGITYYTLGDYLIAGIGTVICVFLLLVTIIGAQIIKGASTKYYKAIIWERILMFLSIPVLILVYIPYNHFWTVQSNEEKIITDFKSAIESSREIFSDYDEYAQNRTNDLKAYLDRAKMSEGLKQNRIDELQLILTSKNYSNLKAEANEWIGNASKSPSVWNVFLFGNIDNIKGAIEKWTYNLNAISSKRTSAETYEVCDFPIDNQAKINALTTLENIKVRYKTTSNTNVISIVTLLICYLMLLLPYFIQERNARNCERFWDFWPFSRTNKVTDLIETEKPYEPRQQPRTPPIQETQESQNKTNTKPRSKKGAPV